MPNNIGDRLWRVEFRSVRDSATSRSGRSELDHNNIDWPSNQVAVSKTKDVEPLYPVNPAEFDNRRFVCLDVFCTVSVDLTMAGYIDDWICNAEVILQYLERQSESAWLVNFGIEWHPRMHDFRLFASQHITGRHWE